MQGKHELMEHYTVQQQLFIIKMHCKYGENVVEIENAMGNLEEITLNTELLLYSTRCKTA